MAEPRYSSADTPEFSSYPAEPEKSSPRIESERLPGERFASDYAAPEGKRRLESDSRGDHFNAGLPGGHESSAANARQGGAFDEPARVLGASLGRIVNTVRTQQGKLAPQMEAVRGTAKDITEDLREEARRHAERARTVASEVAETAKEKARATVEAAKDTARTTAQAAREKAEELSNTLADKMAGDAPGYTAGERIKNRVYSDLERGRTQVRHVVNEYPFHVIAGIALAGFIAGILLRVGRENA